MKNKNTKIINVSNNETSFYPYSIKANKSSGSRNNINDPYAKLYVPDVAENINVKVFNLLSRINKTRQIKWHETCKCKCRLHASFCKNKQRWNKDKCRGECKESMDKGRCEKEFIWNPSNCKCKCDKSSDIGQYLDYENCKCSKILVDKLVEECSENIDGNEMICNDTLNDYEKVCNSCTIYMVLFVIVFLIIVDISSAFIYFNWYLKRRYIGTTIY